ncbi:hypothetical protein I6F07_10595 [Ensifer sp. IC4062]|nr:hypothetical protein [Ensifer sp. IC4062]MCA1440662.1 hypothetical protein [Ensifer sp. IC4062]
MKLQLDQPGDHCNFGGLKPHQQSSANTVLSSFISSLLPALLSSAVYGGAAVMNHTPPKALLPAAHSLKREREWTAEPASSDDAWKEDVSCKAVNRAYLKTKNGPFYSAVLYNVKADGTLKAHQEIRVMESLVYERYSFSAKWQRYSRADVSTVEEQGPVWNSCKLLPQQENATPQINRYSAIWRHFPYRAISEIWISSEDGRLLSVKRHFPDDRWMLPFPTSLVIFSYDPARSTPP